MLPIIVRDTRVAKSWMEHDKIGSNENDIFSHFFDRIDLIDSFLKKGKGEVTRILFDYLK